jgi:hypothetical protein
MTDIDDAMSETQSKAKSKFGVGDDSDETDETDTNADSSNPSNDSDGSKTQNSTETTKTSNSSETSNTSESPRTSDTSNTSNASKTSKTASTADDSDTAATESETETTKNEPVNGDRGRLVDERVNINIYVTDDMRDDLDFLYKQMDLEYTETTGEDLAKNWDFYPAVVRTVLQNKDDLRDELGIS